MLNDVLRVVLGSVMLGDCDVEGGCRGRDDMLVVHVAVRRVVDDVRGCWPITAYGRSEAEHLTGDHCPINRITDSASFTAVHCLKNNHFHCSNNSAITIQPICTRFTTLSRFAQHFTTVHFKILANCSKTCYTSKAVDIQVSFLTDLLKK